MDIVLEKKLNQELRKISIECLYYFAMLAETGQFTQASQKLGITQQALSKSIANLENRIGAKLIKRVGRKNTLTKAGSLFHEKAKAILESFNTLENFSEELEKIKRQPVRIGYLAIWENLIASSELCDFILEHSHEILPSFNLFNDADAVEEAVCKDLIDIALTTSLPVRRGIEYDRLSYYSYSLFGKMYVSENLPDYNYIMLKDSKIRKLEFGQVLKQKIIAETDSCELGLKLCQKGLGALFVPEIAVKETARDDLKLIKEMEDICESLYIIWKKEQKVIYFDKIVNLLSNIN